MDLPAIDQALVIRPGDTLIILIKKPTLTEQHYDRMVEAIKARVDGIDVFMISGVDQLMAYRPESPMKGPAQP